MSSIHNPSNFDPANYEVEDYLDNKRPQYFGQGIEAFEAEVKWWKEEMARTFGPDWVKKIHHCIHCGNGNVRWITATLHIPTGETVVFGSDCTARLGFTDKKSFKLAQLQSKAEAGHAKMKVWKARTQFLETHPEVITLIEQIVEPVHAKNSFAHDVLNKLNQYGTLSDKQIAAVVKSMERDREYEVRKRLEATEVKGDAPSGRVEVTGLVLTTKVQVSDYGETIKMLLKLENNAKVWLTAPSRETIERGDTVTVKATFEVSKDDKHFAFGKRPHLIRRIAAVVEEVQ